ncbi:MULTISPECIES: AzlC family ABC transporter permease [Providencia]|uniref:AzlC family ABC transporter permease n=1 Tax=Providencia TaxID=586 RepID=UPI00197CFB14|nr:MULTISPECIES: AzlC family ABC transporter permease [Providencia]MBN4865304.1 AzlC family ABC transporter permease [Providencia stuartii]MBN4874470.1 AzlC family ABC transporter permease [Providencia stuartii]MBN4879317.1 AzlC family ABC transporter permease [Providencia stuartii]MBN4883671.1 AzlC family ABC transporter permease [Providencia stuartii]HEM8291312.1 AzlC family ABC transporter permease [Providencia stuartii]
MLTSTFNSTLNNSTVKNIALVCFADLIVGISYGALAHSQGFDFWVPLTLSILVLAGASEFLFIGVIFTGGSPISAALAGLLVNSRHIPFSFAVGDLTGKGKKALLGYHIMNDESVVFGLAQETEKEKRAAFWLCGIGILLCWPLGVIIGEVLGSFMDDTHVFGMDAMFPAIILALSLPALKDKRLRLTAIIGAVIAVATTPYLPAGIPVLLALLSLVIYIRK